MTAAGNHRRGDTSVMEQRPMTPLPASPQPPERLDPLADYDYALPPGLVAQTPARRRVQARLMVLDRGQDTAPRHCRVAHLCKLLRPGDLLVLNDTKVVPARLLAAKESGGAVEVFLLNPAMPLERLADGAERHEALVRSHRPLRAGQRLCLGGPDGPWLTVLERGQRGRAVVLTPCGALGLAQRFGRLPLPPYIRRPDGPSLEDGQRYQTVYAQNAGAVAAPTAGLHLSHELLAALARRGVGTARLTLHVGYGTFAEPSAQDLARGKLHAEWVQMNQDACQAVANARRAGGRIIAVGTTSMRALEWLAGPGGAPQPRGGWCDILIQPGHRFKAADGLLTNFHLPRTTLLMLVAALAGRQRVLDAYAEAVRLRYRFYSFGDGMLIL